MDEENAHAELESALHGLQANGIMDNDSNIAKLVIPFSVTRLSDGALRLLGRYIANNTHLINLILSEINVTDEKIGKLFQVLTKSSSIEVLDLENNQIGTEGVRSMIPFLQNSPQLIKINFSGDGIGSQGFEVLVHALDGGSINELILDKCGITDISSLGNVTLPHLKKISLCNNYRLLLHNIHNIGDISSYTSLEELNLSHNSIGIDGCRSIAQLLQKEDTNLTTLNLNNNGIDDEGVEVLANSLKHNKKLNSLHLRGRNLQQKGYLALLKLLGDVSSIENTYNSNHTLKTLDFDMNPPIRSDERTVKKMNTLKTYIRQNTTVNNRPNPGMIKVVHAQLNSQNRKILCKLQGIGYSYESIFSEIDALILPEVLALVAQAQFRDLQTQTELFRMLVTVAPDLSSIVNRPVFFKERIEDNEAKVVALGIKYEREVAALNAEKLEMKRELEALQSGEKTNDKEVQEDEKFERKEEE